MGQRAGVPPAPQPYNRAPPAPGHPPQEAVTFSGMRGGDNFVVYDSNGNIMFR